MMYTHCLVEKSAFNFSQHDTSVIRKHAHSYSTIIPIQNIILNMHHRRECSEGEVLHMAHSFILKPAEKFHGVAKFYNQSLGMHHKNYWLAPGLLESQPVVFARLLIFCNRVCDLVNKNPKCKTPHQLNYLF